jgi:hypothetical protein
MFDGMQRDGHNAGNETYEKSPGVFSNSPNPPAPRTTVNGGKKESLLKRHSV